MSERDKRQLTQVTELRQTPQSTAFLLEPPLGKLGRQGIGGASLTVQKHWRGLNERHIPTTLIAPRHSRNGSPTEYPTFLYDMRAVAERVLQNVADERHISSDALLEIYSDQQVAHYLSQRIHPDAILNAHFYTTQGILQYRPDQRFIYFNHSPFTAVRKLYDPSLQGTEANTTKISKKRTVAEEYLLRNAAAIVFFTDAEIELTQRMYPEIDPTRMRRLPLGIDTNRFNPASKAALKSDVRKKFDIPQDATVMYMQGRVGASVGQLEMAQLFYNNLLDNNNLYLALIGEEARGEGAYMDQLRDVSAQSDGKIVLTGRLPQEEGHALGDIITVLKLETFGYAALEAMAVGNRVISQDNPIHREVYGENPGVLYVPYNYLHGSEVLACMEKFVGDNTYSSHARAYNPEAAKRYPWEASVNALEEIMCEILTK